jgi:hypothetical protein
VRARLMRRRVLYTSERSDVADVVARFVFGTRELRGVSRFFTRETI